MIGASEAVKTAVQQSMPSGGMTTGGIKAYSVSGRIESRILDKQLEKK